MKRRQPEVVVDHSGLPADLLNGPCIEDWSKSGDTHPHFAAWRRWHDAIDEWALRAGYASQGPLSNARNLARIRLPWSRHYLREHGRADLADYYDGLLSEVPPNQSQVNGGGLAWEPRQ